MTLEELWQLFPIIIEPHNDAWKDYFVEESEIIKKIIGDKFAYNINHVGSTSIKNIAAKPIVDILLEVDIANIRAAALLFSQNGWIIMHEEPCRIVLNKGYTEKGFAERVFHMHVKAFGDNKEVVFSNYMNGHPDEAREYERLKLSLLPRFKNDRDGYTEAKTAFCNEIYKKAYAELGAGK